jgi:dTDP-4-dehydrorhamnose reductase
VFAPTRHELDLCDRGKIAEVVAAKRWSGVINAAAYTEVDRAESDRPMAFVVNATAPAALAVETARRSIPLIHISTDYVFDGKKSRPYEEDDEVAPVNTYGHSKLDGEQAVRTANPQHIILRTSWVHSPYRKNFVKTILRLAAERDSLSIVADQRGCPTAASDIAKTCLELAMACAASPQRTSYGTYHFAGAGEASWFEFAAEIVRIASTRAGRSPQILPIRTRDYPTAAVRPMDTRLNCSALKRKFGRTPRPWREGLETTIDHVLAKGII